MESINNACTAYVRIATSTVCGCVWEFNIDFHALSLIKTDLNGKYTLNVRDTHQMRPFR